MTILRGNDSDEVFFGGADPDVVLAGGGNDDLWGRGGGDVLDGGAGDDRIDGAEGDDLIIGGAGADRLTGGIGSDMFLYRSASDSTAAQQDTIVGFETGVDRINLIPLGATSVDLSWDGVATLITAETAAGSVRIRVENMVKLSDLLVTPDQNPPATAGADILLVTPGANGGDGSDRLIGGDESEFVDGGFGGDIMIGGRGDDGYAVNSFQDLVIEEADQGIDTVYIRSVSAYTLPDNVENLVLLTVDSGFGNDLDNVITGNIIANFLAGNGGNDVLIGGGGGDSLAGDSLANEHGADRFVYLAASDSTASAMDRLGFETGIDKIDLLALGPVGIRQSLVPDPIGGTYNLVEVATSAGLMAIRTDTPANQSDFLFVPGPQTSTGTSGNDRIAGFNTADTMFLQQGGSDSASGDLGNDAFYFGAALDSGDKVDGGGGTDTLAVQGGSEIRLGDISNVEVLLALSGSDARFGDTANNRYSYGIATQDANVSAGQIFTVIATGLLLGENVHFDGSAESEGSFRIFAGQGVDILKGGAGSDGFFFGAEGNLTADDRIDGGAGVDTLALRGNYWGTGAIAFAASSFTSIEVLSLLSGHNNDFSGGLVASGYDYDITLANGNVAAGQLLDVNASRLGSDEQLRFDGRAETDGAFRILAGAADDSLFGGAGNDTIYGGLGKDALQGGPGADTYQYRSAAESTSTGYDAISGFDWHVDRIDAPGSATRSLSGSAQGSLSTGSFDSDLALGVTPVLGAGQAVLFTANAGTLAGHVFAVIDVNGTAGYQAGEDLVIELVNPILPIDPAAALIV